MGVVRTRSSQRRPYAGARMALRGREMALRGRRATSAGLPLISESPRQYHRSSVTHTPVSPLRRMCLGLADDPLGISLEDGARGERHDLGSFVRVNTQHRALEFSEAREPGFYEQHDLVGALNLALPMVVRNRPGETRYAGADPVLKNGVRQGLSGLVVGGGEEDDEKLVTGDHVPPVFSCCSVD